MLKKHTRMTAVIASAFALFAAAAAVAASATAPVPPDAVHIDWNAITEQANQTFYFD